MTAALHAVDALPQQWIIGLRCPVCKRELAEADLFGDQSVRCSCGYLIEKRHGIWRGLSAAAAERFRRFMENYGAIRAAEGRSASDDEYYLALPFEDRTGRNSWQWAIRSRTYHFFLSEILSPLERRSARPLDVLDIGAGNGWLSYRLSLRGHRSVAIDLLDNDWDGLGATHHYLAHLCDPFAVVQAEMDLLPFAEGQFDLAIFNASFHYSTDYIRTVREALRCLRPGGGVVILDTPFYQHESSGRRMVRQREAEFEKKYGFKSNSVSSREFLTRKSLDEVARACGIRWAEFHPWYGWKWALRPWKARLLRRREPSKFYVFWGQQE